MKYCLSGRQPDSILKQIDEIRVLSKDYRIITDYLIDYPQAKIILELPRDFEEKKDTILQYNEIANKNRLVCCLNSLAEIKWFKENEVPFYYGLPINSYYDFQALEELGVEYIRITAPLTHNIRFLQNRRKVQVRATPNVAYDAYIPRISGIEGGWIRPEDIQYYENGIDVFEFEGKLDLKQERTMWEIYKKGRWPGNLDLLITNLNQDVLSAGLPEEFGRFRSTCRQSCMQNGDCHYCKTAFTLTQLLEKKVKEEKKETK